MRDREDLRGSTRPERATRPGVAGRPDADLVRTYFEELAATPETGVLGAEEENALARELHAVRDELRAAVLATGFASQQLERLLLEVERGTLSLDEAFELDLTRKGSRAAVRARVEEHLAELAAGASAARRFAIARSYEIRIGFIVWWLAEHLERSDEGEEVLRRLHHRYARLKARLAGSSLRWVVRIAKGYRGRGLGFIDLIQEGNVGLMRACDKFDPSLGYRFTTYATFWIRQSIGRALENQSTMIRIPEAGRKLRRKARRAAASYRQENGELPHLDDLAALCSSDRAALEQLFVAEREPVSVDDACEEGGTPLAELLADRRTLPPEAPLMAESLRDSVSSHLERLGERERVVVTARFGLDGRDPRTFVEIADALGVSRERARQVFFRALDRLRERMTSSRSAVV